MPWQVDAMLHRYLPKRRDLCCGASCRGLRGVALFVDGPVDLFSISHRAAIGASPLEDASPDAVDAGVSGLFQTASRSRLLHLPSVRRTYCGTRCWISHVATLPGRRPTFQSSGISERQFIETHDSGLPVL